MNETEIQRVLFKQLIQVRKRYQIAIPNVYLFGEWESDFVGITKYGYAHEFEIKRSKQDYLNDFLNKRKKHQTLRSYFSSPSLADIPKNFYFVCHGFWLNARELPPYAGLVVVTKNGIVKMVKRAPDLPAKKIDEGKLIKIATSLSYRLWERW